MGKQAPLLLLTLLCKQILFCCVNVNIYHVNFPFWIIKGYCIVLYCIALHCIALHCIALHCIALHCIALHCIALHCIALHCRLLYCTDWEEGGVQWENKHHYYY